MAAKVPVFLVSDPIGLLASLWVILAFFVRPLLLGAHDGAAGGLFDTLRNSFHPLALAQVAAAAQWMSFAGLMTLAVIVHKRFASQASAYLVQRAAIWIVSAYAVLLCAAYLVFLWGPATALSLMAHDSFIFMDASYRIAEGQTPSVDFPTPIGAAALYLPALGAWLAGGYAGSVELASAFVALGLGLACACLGANRLPASITAMLIAVIFLIATPAALIGDWGGESVTVASGKTVPIADNLTWAMFYNRWGWAALIPMFAALSPRPDAEPRIAEIAVMSAILAFLFYLKLTYFVVGAGAALVWGLVNARPLRTLAIGGGMAVGFCLAIGLMTGNLVGYLEDVFTAARISGGRTDTLAAVIRKNLQDILLASAPMAIVAATVRLTWRDALACGFMLAGSLFVINQNAQLTGILSLTGLAAYGVARVGDHGGGLARLAATSAFFILASSTILERVMILMDQAAASRREEARAPAGWSDIPALKGIYISERESALSLIEGATGEEAAREALLIIGGMGRRQELRQGEYMQSLMAGMEDLKPILRPGDSIATLDMSNPFPVLLGARSSPGSWLSLHHDRTVSEDVHPDASIAFADADHVMIAKLSMLPATAELMLTLYDDWLTANYQQRVESKFWIRYSHPKAGPGGGG